MQLSLQRDINSFCCFQAVPLPSLLLLLSGCLTREQLAGQFRGCYCNQEDFSALAAGENLSADFAFSQRMEKDAGFAHLFFIDFGGWLLLLALPGSPPSGTAPGPGASLLKGHTMLPKCS